ncbi:acid trehalase-like protein [Acrasis kona]|uniref:Acid trehalase-like protein n=1 Tax=Acrasis kona TaxID=1008807 RepID=A0AAW2Z695_9EUKA
MSDDIVSGDAIIYDKEVHDSFAVSRTLYYYKHNIQPYIGNGYVTRSVSAESPIIVNHLTQSGVFSKCQNIGMTSTLGSNVKLKLSLILLLLKGYFERHSAFYDPTHCNIAATVVQRFYAHRNHPNLIVHELILEKIDNSRSDVDVKFKQQVLLLVEDKIPQNPFTLADNKKNRLMLKSIVISGQESERELKKKALHTLQEISGDQEVFEIDPSENNLFLSHCKEWRSLWTSSLQIDGPLQSIVTTSQYYLLSLLSSHSFSKGITPEHVSEHQPWLVSHHSETYVLPTILMFHPHMALTMLQYRSNRSSTAKKTCETSGYMGMMFPKYGKYFEDEISSDGANPSVHVSSGVAIANHLYYQSTGDVDWVLSHGFEMSSQIALFLNSKSELLPDKSHDYHIRHVNGINADAKSISDDFYTNAASSTALYDAGRFINDFGYCYEHYHNYLRHHWNDMAIHVHMPFNGHRHYQNYEHQLLNDDRDDDDDDKSVDDSKNMFLEPDVVLAHARGYLNGEKKHLKKVNHVKVMINDLKYYEGKMNRVSGQVGVIDSTGCTAWLQAARAYKHYGTSDLISRAHHSLQSALTMNVGPFGVWFSHPSFKHSSRHHVSSAASFLHSLMYGFCGFRFGKYHEHIESISIRDALVVEPIIINNKIVLPGEGGEVRLDNIFYRKYRITLKMEAAGGVTMFCNYNSHSQSAHVRVVSVLSNKVYVFSMDCHERNILQLGLSSKIAVLSPITSNNTCTKGAHPDQQNWYYKQHVSNVFKCKDGLGGPFAFSRVNDGYCDCPGDGSDEPGTDACKRGRFFCPFLPNVTISSGMVNDGICDCCDGSDEQSGIVKCEVNKCYDEKRDIEIQKRKERQEAEENMFDGVLIIVFLIAAAHIVIIGVVMFCFVWKGSCRKSKAKNY